MKTLNELIEEYTHHLQQGEIQIAYKGILEFLGKPPFNDYTIYPSGLAIHTLKNPIFSKMVNIFCASKLGALIAINDFRFSISLDGRIDSL